MTSYVVTFIAESAKTGSSDTKTASTAASAADDPDSDDEGMLVLTLLWGFITVGRFIGLWRQIQTSRKCDEEDTAAAAAGVVGGASAQHSSWAVATVHHDLRAFLATAVVGGLLLASFSPDSGGREMWMLGLALYGLGNGPTLGLVYDLANRTTVHSEAGTSIIMFGLNLGASLVPWISAKVRFSGRFSQVPYPLSLPSCLPMVFHQPLRCGQRLARRQS